MGGGLVKAAWFKHYREDELPVRFDRIVQSWDAANKTTKLSDFSFCTTWGVRDAASRRGGSDYPVRFGRPQSIVFLSGRDGGLACSERLGGGVTRWWAQAFTSYGDTGIGHCIELSMQTESAY